MENVEVKNMSDTIADLVKALSAAQSKIKTVQKNAENPFFKKRYADLAAIWDAIREPITTQGLAIVQLVKPNPECAEVETILFHSTGQWIKSTIVLKADKIDPQRMGSAITYARRYALSAMLGIASEDDDDANAVSDASKKTNNQTAPAAAGSVPATPAAPQAANPNALISEPQMKKMHVQAKALGIAGEKMHELFGVMFGKKSSKDLLMKEASQVIEILTKIKTAVELDALIMEKKHKPSADAEKALMNELDKDELNMGTNDEHAPF